MLLEIKQKLSRCVAKLTQIHGVLPDLVIVLQNKGLAFLYSQVEKAGQLHVGGTRKITQGVDVYRLGETHELGFCPV